VGIYSSLEFLDADPVTLRRIVFKSVVGEWWYKRLRGFEVDDVETKMGRVGRQYVLERFDLTHEEIAQRLHHLCESVGSRLRMQGKAARGVYVYAKTLEKGYWHSSTLSPLPFFSNKSIYTQAAQLFAKAPDGLKEIGIHCYELAELEDSQISLFADEIARERQVAEAIDGLNKRYGERTVHSADTLKTGIYVSTKIPFGSTRYL
jgi:DNA polymerase-4